MPEVHVSLTTIRAHACAEGKETLEQPMDVAILSKGNDFVWGKLRRFGTA